jgi:hypothetical protein
MGRWNERVIGQKGFFDVERRLEAISAKGNPLETIKRIVPWEDFPRGHRGGDETTPQRKSNAGRKPYDAILKFKIVVLQSLRNLSDEQTEYLIRTAYRSFAFSVWNSRTSVPDGTMIWLFREALAQAVLDTGVGQIEQHKLIRTTFTSPSIRSIVAALTASNCPPAGAFACRRRRHIAKATALGWRYSPVNKGCGSHRPKYP